MQTASMIRACGTPWVSATSERTTAASVAPTCGISPSRPAMIPSASAKGTPSSQAAVPWIVPAIPAITTAPSA